MNVYDIEDIIDKLENYVKLLKAQQRKCDVHKCHDCGNYRFVYYEIKELEQMIIGLKTFVFNSTYDEIYMKHE